MFSYTDISLQEIPGEISLVLYTGTCPCRCPWCFNSDLLDKKPLSFKQMKDAIQEHDDFITAVVFSGGEPLNNPFLIKTIKYCKDKGLKIKLNTNGLVDDNLKKNIFLPYVDYINISLKGIRVNYDYVLKSPKVHPCIPLCNTLEYSFVYSRHIWPDVYLKLFRDFLLNKISFDWSTAFSYKWSQPDIFTVSQVQVGNCLNPQYNDCNVPTESECIEVAKIFKDIPKKKLIVETKEFGRKSI